MKWKEQLHSDIAQLLALIPTSLGMLIRRAYYKLVLKRCGKNLVVEWLSWITTVKAEIGDNVWIGSYSIIAHVNIGDDVMIASHAVLLSQSSGHKSGSRDVTTTQTQIGSHVWIGSHCTIRNHVSDHTIIGANSIVTKTFPPYCTIGGCPAIVLKTNTPNTTI